VDDKLVAALRAAIDWLESRNYRFAVIGGIANQHWGTTRITHDVDFKVLVPELDYATIRDALRTDFPERGRPRAPLSPLVVDVMIDETTVDFLLAIPGYDEQVVTRAVQCELEGLPAWLCTAEDLIIQKAVAGRGRDWQDIEGILIEQRGQLDLEYVEDWLTQFAELLERPEILTQYQEIQAHIAEAVAELNGE
jgi:predicted nucleotidyltransferase